MIETDLDHCRIIMESLNQGGGLDTEAQASLDVLNHRLATLKKSYPQLGKVAFSAAVERSRAQASVQTMS
ncbi:MAG: hypothetical protein IH892_22090 [Planctomycetes bacterium]|nr:hypothetical protein [Planctomycetota bacterium]